MQAQAGKIELVKNLQAKINMMQGLGKLPAGLPEGTLLPFANAFPGNIFPVGAFHEFISYNHSESASTTGFIAALTGRLIRENSLCLWIGNERTVFPCSLNHFGLEPDRIVFINTANQKNALWIIEEALKCEVLTAVIGEIKELGFSESRRLQLAVERSGVNCFLHRHNPRIQGTVACTTRWKISSLASTEDSGLPGIGHSCWNVQLLKVRNGKPDSWNVSWMNNTFITLSETKLTSLPIIQSHAV